MEKLLLLILCLPLAVAAQQPPNADTVIKKPWSLTQPIRSIRINKKELVIKPIKPRRLNIGGTYTAAGGLTTGNDAPDNHILHEGYKLGHSLYFKASIERDRWKPLWALTLSAGQNTENLILRNNNNSGNHLSIGVQRFLGKQLTLSGGYSTNSSHLANSNLYGFLNHIYEAALLDDPAVLPNSPNHGEQTKQHTGFLAIQKRNGNLNYSLTTSVDAVDNKINQQLRRHQHETHYNGDANAAYNIRYPGYRWTSTAKFHFLHDHDEVNIAYPVAGPTYRYTRTADEGDLDFSTLYNYDYTTTGFAIGDKFYHSTTGTRQSFFLPEASAFVYRSNILNYSSSARLAVTYSAFYSEPALNRSWSPYLLTQLLPQQSAGFMPATELATINGLSPVRHQEFTSKLDLTLWYWLTASADLSLRTSKDNPYPVYANNQLTLRNLADIRYRGLELTLTQNTYRRKAKQLIVNNSISFWRYTNIVTRIAGGLDSLPIAGFENVHNTLIKGQPVGVITGNTYPKNTAPGNPDPEYTLKLSHQASWERLTLSTDWQFRKGGDVWNGTRAALENRGIPPTTAAYMQKADNIRINLLSLACNIPLKHPHQTIKLLAYAENLVLWSAYKGGDPQQRLFDQPDANGLDFFNLPSVKSFGLNASIQF